MLIGKLIIIFFIIIFLKKTNFFNSPVKRLFFIPLLYFLLNIFIYFLFKKIILSFNFIFILFVEGYILFQLVNLANTSRRINYLISNKGNIGLSAQQRIDHFLEDGILIETKKNNIYGINKVFYYELLSKISDLFKSIFR